MMMGTSSYIPFPALNSLTAEFYIALDEVRPPVPEAGMRPAADIVSHLGDDDLLLLVVSHAHSKVAQYALDALSRRGIGLSAFTSRLCSFCR
jgi:hypothetical protein